ncbi:MAG: hypothetical protein PHV93_01210 [Candidatus Pacebacteria bacterium]|nr:hypothetical protein [Candidatus Paceibacterota bacterium]
MPIGALFLSFCALVMLVIAPFGFYAGFKRPKECTLPRTTLALSLICLPSLLCVGFYLGSWYYPSPLRPDRIEFGLIYKIDARVPDGDGTLYILSQSSDQMKLLVRDSGSLPAGLAECSVVRDWEHQETHLSLVPSPR